VRLSQFRKCQELKSTISLQFWDLIKSSNSNSKSINRVDILLHPIKFVKNIGVTETPHKIQRIIFKVTQKVFIREDDVHIKQSAYKDTMISMR
jgi:hypothetical protein